VPPVDGLLRIRWGFISSAYEVFFFAMSLFAFSDSAGGHYTLPPFGLLS